MRRAQALLTLATGIGQQATSRAVGLSRQALGQLRHRDEASGWQVALAEAPRSGAPLRFDGPQRAAVTARRWSARPPRWTQPLGIAPARR